MTSKKLLWIVIILFFLNVAAQSSTDQSNNFVGTSWGYGKTGDINFNQLSKSTDKQANFANTASFALSQRQPTSLDIEAIKQYMPDQSSKISSEMSNAELVRTREEIQKNFYQGLSVEEKRIYDNLKNSNPYVQKNFQENPKAKSGFEKGSAEIDSKGQMTITQPVNEEVFAKIPKGYEISENKGDSLEFVNKESSPDSKLEVKGNQFITEKDSKVNIANENGINTIKLQGKGDLETKDTGSSETKSFKGIKDATFKFDEKNNIKYAKFDSEKGGNYKLMHDKKSYSFESSPNGKITFDPDNKVIKGEKTSLMFGEDKGKKFGSGKFIDPLGKETNLPFGMYRIEAEKFSLKLDDKGNVIQANLFGNNNQAESVSRIINSHGIFSSKKNSKDLAVFFDKNKETDIKNLPGNVISISENENNPSISFKGNFDYKGLNGYHLEGFGKGSYKPGSEYSQKEDAFAKFNYGENSFKVLSGDVNIDNKVHLVTVKNGEEISLSRTNLVADNSEKNPESFKVIAGKTGKENIAYVDETLNKLSVTSRNDDKASETAVIPLSDFEGKIKDPYTMQREFVDNYHKMIDSLEKSGKTTEAEAMKLSVIESERLLNDIKYSRGLTSVNPSLAEKNSLIEYLRDVKNPNLQFNAELRMLELDTEMKLGQGRYSSDVQKTIDSYQNHIDSYSKDTKKQDILRMDKAQALGMFKDFDSANQEYFKVAQTTSSKDVASIAFTRMASIDASRSRFSDAYKYLDEALAKNPDNIQAKEMKQVMALGALEYDYNKMIKEKGAITEEFNKNFGESTLKAFWRDGIGSLTSDLVGRTEGIKDYISERIKQTYGDQAFRENIAVKNLIGKDVPAGDLYKLDSIALQQRAYGKISGSYTDKNDAIASILMKEYGFSQDDAYSASVAITKYQGNLDEKVSSILKGDEKRITEFSRIDMAAWKAGEVPILGIFSGRDISLMAAGGPLAKLGSSALGLSAKAIGLGESLGFASSQIAKIPSEAKSIGSVLGSYGIYKGTYELTGNENAAAIASSILPGVKIGREYMQVRTAILSSSLAAEQEAIADLARAGLGAKTSAATGLGKTAAEVKEDFLKYSNGKTLYPLKESAIAKDAKEFLSITYPEGIGSGIPRDVPIGTYEGLREYNKWRVFDFEGKVNPNAFLTKDGRFMTYGAPAEGKFIWTINKEGKLNIGLRQSRDTQLLPHSALTDGKEVYGAGEVIFKNGKVVEINGHSGHYVPELSIDRSTFNSDSIEAFKEYSRLSGLSLNKNVKFNYAPPVENMPKPVIKTKPPVTGNPAWRLPGD